MRDIIDTTEMYLKTIYEVEEDGVAPLRARIVERLGHSGPTVSQTVARIERDGYLVVRRDRQIELTKAGRELATRVIRKHRLAERLLVDVIGLAWELAHDEACRWEHVMSDEVEKKLKKILKNTKFDPYGNAIPGEGGKNEAGTCLLDIPDGEEDIRARIIRLGEPAQAEPGLLSQFVDEGISAGSVVYLTPEADGVVIKSHRNADEIKVNEYSCRHLFVTIL